MAGQTWKAPRVRPWMHDALMGHVMGVLGGFASCLDFSEAKQCAAFAACLLLTLSLGHLQMGWAYP